jgi:hypothetical protein
MKISKIAFASLLAVSSAACWAADESKLDLVYRSAVRADNQASDAQSVQTQMATTPAGACTVVVTAPKDIRKNKDTLGSTFRDNPILSNQSPTIWLETVLLDLKGRGFQTVSGSAQGGPSSPRVATISADLDKLYIWNHSMNLHATLVVRAKIQSSGGGKLEKTYRLNSTKLNWANTDGEFIETINLAADRLLEKLTVDLESACANKISV